ncbi:hypothetical protein [Acinetobacter schindleri]|jgi:type IV pilus assembly protein PilY1|uniref:pilus assembly protein n=1 Tax=Acinetobacter schindleri TaxID=108981 RepID=UPI0028D42A9C|nr:hypothetical protein [Acinetobacter schindleri]
MKKIKKNAVFTLSALSAAMVCQTVTSYASDIEIYKAPTEGGATLMFVLDLSGSMSQSEDNAVQRDFFGGTGTSCDSEKKVVRTVLNGKNFDFDGAYCYINQNEYNSLNSTLRSKIDNEVTAKTCIKEEKTFRKWEGGLIFGKWVYYKEMTYSCPDRVTMLVRSLFDLISGNSSVDEGKIATTNDPLPDISSVGLTTFRSGIPSVKKSPLLLTPENKESLLTEIKSWSATGGTPISYAYAQATAGLLDHVSKVEAACAGYGVYYLTDGSPDGDSLSSAKTTFNSKVDAKYKLSDAECTGDSSNAWSCVQTMAQKLQEKKNNSEVEIKTAVVGFGSAFSFIDKTTNEKVIYDPDETYSDTTLASYFSGNTLAAAKAAVTGHGGWYSASNTSDIVNSVEIFVNSIKVPIPAITTGTAAIPQDTLNTIAIQPYAYFPQFEPKPSEKYRAWVGNIKKFKVVNATLEGQNNKKVFKTSNAELDKETLDFWIQSAGSDALKAYGGMLSKLKLRANTTPALQRKVYTNSNSTISTVNAQYLENNIKTGNNKYLLGILGYDVTESDLTTLLNSLTGTTKFSLTNTNLTSKEELRSIGAIMHSTPLLLTQTGKITYDATKKENTTVDRDDYILFGTTQGTLHVVKAGRESDTYESEATVGTYVGGEEVFTFVPQETLSNQPQALLAQKNTETEAGMNELYYGIDAPWTSHTEYVYDVDNDKFKVYISDTKKGKQWVYGGMRMGGRSYYALDLTNIDKPSIKFRIDPAASTVYSVSNTYTNTDLAKMGQSWSKPLIANVQWKGKRRLVMFVGGGYDPGYESFKYVQDAESNTQNTATGTGKGIGAGVFMFDANTGEPLWSTYDSSGGDKDKLKYSIVSQIKGIDREGDGDIDHLYFGDLGGQVFRIDLDNQHGVSTTTANFSKKITRLLNLNKANGYSPRFYETPGFSIYKNTAGTGKFAVVSIGSGNRSNPLLGKVLSTNDAGVKTYLLTGETATTNANLEKDAIYNIYDLAVMDADPSTSTLGPNSAIKSNLFEVTNKERVAGTSGATATTAYNESTTYKGWYYPFTSSVATITSKAVEKVQGDLILLDSDLYVSTFDAEGVGLEESCGAGIYGSSRAHRFCMPYGQCPAGDTVENNTMSLGKGILGVTIGGGTDGKNTSRSIVAPVNSRSPSTNKILNTVYGSGPKLVPQSWYERN